MKKLTPTQIKDAILELTGFSIEEYAELVWDTGIRFAYLYTNEDDWAVRIMTQTSHYWSWWRNQWNIVDTAILEDREKRDGTPTKEFYRRQYLIRHSLKNMVATPNQMVMDATYSAMTTKVWKQTMQQS